MTDLVGREQPVIGAVRPDGTQLETAANPADERDQIALSRIEGLVGAVLLLGLLDERDDVAHAEDASGHAVRVEGFEVFERFAETGERRAFTTEEMQALGVALNEAEATGSVTVQDRRGKSQTHHVARVAVLAVRLLALTGFRRAELFSRL